MEPVGVPSSRLLLVLFAVCVVRVGGQAPEWVQPGLWGAEGVGALGDALTTRSSSLH